MKGFKKDGKFRPTGNKSKSSLKKSDIRKKHTSGMPKGVEPHDTFSKQEKLRLLDEDDLARHYSNQQLEDIRDDIDATMRSLSSNDPEHDMLAHERRKVQGAMNKHLFKSLGGGTVIPEFESTGFPEVDDMLPDHKESLDTSESDMIHTILQKTDDGDELSGQHLGLIEAGANHNLTEEGKKALKELYDQVNSGHYELPAFHGIKNMTKDQEGFVYWKGKQVEHYSHDDWEDEEFSAKKLEANILDLEAKGVPVTSGNILNNYDNLEANQSQWKRTDYLVTALTDNRWGERDWTYGRDKQHAKEEFVRKHPDARFDELEVLTNEEWNEKYPRR